MHSTKFLHNICNMRGIMRMLMQVCNRSKVTCLVSFAQAAQQLAQHAVELAPAGNVTIPARDALDVTFFYRCGHVVTFHASTSKYTHAL